MQITKRILLSTLAGALGILIACGCQNSIIEYPSAKEGGTSSIRLSDRNFTPDSFVTAGWKKSKQYDTATVPESTEIWYGFFNQKDIEIRFYETHEAAVEIGIPGAISSIESAVKRSKGGKLLDFSGGSFTGYADYLVAGNAVLLCEFDRTQCDQLIANIE
ncbi:MAG: DUF6810 family protein [Chloroflexota bacterium]|nr:DUF6810 family protein [Chloroflexota bacterium]|tara:strand:+ start:22985 stop:23467 length:483 start_codon:yes stop_codon:yes gene_type:complete